MGVILAGWLAGYIADKLGWEYSFIIFGAVGVVWGVIMAIRLKDKKNDSHVADVEVAGNDVKKVGILDGFSGLFFVITGFMTWVPAFLQEEFGQISRSFRFMEDAVRKELEGLADLDAITTVSDFSNAAFKGLAHMLNEI